MHTTLKLCKKLKVPVHIEISDKIIPLSTNNADIMKYQSPAKMEDT